MQKKLMEVKQLHNCSQNSDDEEAPGLQFVRQEQQAPLDQSAEVNAHTFQPPNNYLLDISNYCRMPTSPGSEESYNKSKSNSKS